MLITLTPEIEQALAEQSQKQGTTPEQLALDSLRKQFVKSTRKRNPEMKGTLADFLDEFIGVIQSDELIPGDAKMSEATSKVFAEGLLKKRLSGRPLAFMVSRETGLT
jgi:hypothetical protein